MRRVVFKDFSECFVIIIILLHSSKREVCLETCIYDFADVY